MAKTDIEFAELILVIKEHPVKRERDAAFEEIRRELEFEVRKLSSKYYISGSDSQDTMQEAYIGIWKAVLDWSATGGMSFRNFAINLCCKRHIITAISTSRRKKFDPLNSAISLSLPLTMNDDDNEQYLSDLIPDPDDTPLDQLISRQDYEAKSNKVCNKLTKMEEKIFTEYMKGQSYNEIAISLGIKSKAVDNALVRIRKKAAEMYESLEDDEID